MGHGPGHHGYVYVGWGSGVCRQRGTCGVGPAGGGQVQVQCCGCMWLREQDGQGSVVPMTPSHAFALLFLDIPVILTRPLEPKVGREQQSVVLSCDFRPAPKAVQWYKEDTPLASSGKFKMMLEGQMAELRILRLTPADAGVYRCQAGNAQSSAEVTVEGRKLGRRAVDPALGQG